MAGAPTSVTLAGFTSRGTVPMGGTAGMEPLLPAPPEGGVTITRPSLLIAPDGVNGGGVPFGAGRRIGTSMPLAGGGASGGGTGTGLVPGGTVGAGVLVEPRSALPLRSVSRLSVGAGDNGVVDWAWLSIEPAIILPAAASAAMSFRMSFLFMLILEAG